MAYRCFDYECTVCKRREERLVKPEEVAEQRCDLCSEAMSRLVNSSGHYTIAGDNSASTRPKNTVRRN